MSSRENVFTQFDSILSAKLPRAKKICRLMYIDKRNYGYLNMILPQKFDKFLVYTQEMGKQATPSSKFKDLPGASWYDASEWDSFREARLAEGWRDITSNLIDRNKLIPSGEVNLIPDRFGMNAGVLLDRIQYIVDSREAQSNARALSFYEREGSLDTFYNTNIMVFTKKTLNDGKKLLKSIQTMEMTDDVAEYVERINAALKELYSVLPHIIDPFDKGGIQKRWLNYSEGMDRSTLDDELKKIIDRETVELDLIKMRNESWLEKFKRPQLEEGTDRLDVDFDGNHVVIRNSDASLEAEVKEKLRSLSGNLVGCWYVENDGTKSRYESNLSKASGEHKNEMILWHGSQTENWISIIKTGLDMAHAGHGMFGKGIYFAPKGRKSAGYTSVKNSYWAHGKDKTGFLALFKVRTGKQLDTQHSGNYDAQRLKSEGNYDSVYAHAGKELKNDEVIVYKDGQCTIYALVEITGDFPD